MEAVEKLLQVPVDYFVKFNFNSFTKIVDGLDGIEVDVPVEFTGKIVKMNLIRSI